MHSTLNVNRQRAREQQQQFAVGELERQSRRDQDSFFIKVQCISSSLYSCRQKFRSLMQNPHTDGSKPYSKRR